MSGFVPWYPQGGAQGASIPKHPWDQVSLAGQIIPCHHARITAGKLGLLRDKKKTLGGNGAHPTYHGIDPKLVSIAVFFSTVEQMRDFAEMMAGIGPNTKTLPPPVPIDAQQLQHLPTIATVKVVEIGPMEDQGIYKRCIVECDHWMNPPASQRSSKRSATSTPKRPENGVTDAARKKAERDNPKPSAQAGFCGGGFSPAA